MRVARSPLLGWCFCTLAAVFPLAAGAEPGIQVVVTSKPAHSLVASVMAGVGVPEPELLVTSAASPHSYALKPSDARKVSQADVFFRVSEELEPFTRRLVGTLPGSVRVASLAESPGIELLERRRGGAFAAVGDGHEHEDGLGRDPHVWLDPENAKAMVRYAADVLAAAAPEKAAAFKANAEVEISRISALADELAVQLVPLAGKPFIVYHDAYQYLERRFGLTAAGAVAVGADASPGARRLRDLRRQIASAGVLCVFSEPQRNPRAADAIVEGTGARTGVLDPEGTSLTPGPNLYATLMRNLTEGLKSCLSR